MKENAGVHDEGDDHRMDVRRAPCEADLCKNGREGKGEEPEAFCRIRHLEIVPEHQQEAACHAVELKIKDDLSAGVPALFIESADTGVGARRAEGRYDADECIAIEGRVIPDFQHHCRTGSNDEEPEAHVPRGRGLEKNRRKDAHEEGSELDKDLCIAERQPFEAEEKEQDAHPAEEAARMKEQPVFSGKKRERLSGCDERQEEEPYEAAYKRQLARPEVGDCFRRYVHQCEKKRRKDRSKDPECHRRRFCGHDWVQ